jgi:hypothetical protein
MRALRKISACSRWTTIVRIDHVPGIGSASSYASVSPPAASRKSFAPAAYRSTNVE